MKKEFTVFALTIIILALLAGLSTHPVNASVIQFNEGQITTNSASQTNPDIDGSTLVYQDNRSGTWDIYMYTLQGSFTPETRITANSGNNTNPKIYNDAIVYQSDRNGNWDIYLYNITSKFETRITNNSADQVNPDIDGNHIVWQDNRDGQWDIWMYNLSTCTESRVTSSPSQNPAISGNRIVYEQFINYSTMYSIETGRRIFETDLSTGQVVDIGLASYPGSYYQGYTDVNTWYPQVLFGHGWSRFPGPVELSRPEISGDIVTYYDINPHWDSIPGIYMTNLTSMLTTRISSSGENPSVTENQPGIYYIVYQMTAGTGAYANNHIYLYTTAYSDTGGTPATFMVTNNTASQQNPAVSDGRIVYMDNRNSNWDIYMTSVGYILKTTSPPHGGNLGSSLESSASPTPSAPPSPSPSAYPTSTQAPTPASSATPSPTSTVPELTWLVVLPLFASLLLVAMIQRHHKAKAWKSSRSQ